MSMSMRRKWKVNTHTHRVTPILVTECACSIFSSTCKRLLCVFLAMQCKPWEGGREREKIKEPYLSIHVERKVRSLVAFVLLWCSGFSCRYCCCYLFCCCYNRCCDCGCVVFINAVAFIVFDVVVCSLTNYRKMRINE